jgi:hypothetical protein
MIPESSESKNTRSCWANMKGDAAACTAQGHKRCICPTLFEARFKIKYQFLECFSFFLLVFQTRPLFFGHPPLLGRGEFNSRVYSGSVKTKIKFDREALVHW